VEQTYMTKIQICKSVFRAGRFVTTGCCAVLLLLLSACGSTDQADIPPPEAVAKASTSASAPAETSNPLADMVKAVPATTGEQPVELRFDLTNLPVVDQPFDINLNVLALVDASGLELKVTPHSGTEVIAGEKASFGILKTGGSVHHTFRLRGSTTGITAIDVQLTAMVEGKPSTANFAIPVALAAAPEITVATGGK
jgi:hypothetical protein